VIEIVQADLQGLVFVARAMRERDRQEIYATQVGEDPDGLAQAAVGSRFSFLTLSRGVPIAAHGAGHMWPGVWGVWMFATDFYGWAAGAAIMKHYRRVVIPGVLAEGGHRAQCDSIALHNEAHAFIERLGGRAESTMPGYGREGQAFIRYVWDQEAMERQVRKHCTLRNSTV
jgi:hypothetical protein